MNKETLFIPEWTQVTARERAMKPALTVLGAGYAVRRPLKKHTCAADLFVEQISKGWLALAVDDIEYGELVQSSMLDTSQRSRFEERLTDLQLLAKKYGLGGSTDRSSGIRALVILRKCSTEEVNILAADYFKRFQIDVISGKQFEQLSTQLIPRHLTALATEQVNSMRSQFFPESEIAATHTTHQYLHRSNEATLPKFYLDADQEWASKLDLDLPGEQQTTAKDMSVRLINGIAGSGKTLIAINRALMLAEMYPQQRILMLIHNTPVVADLTARLHRVRGGVPKNLVIETFFSWAAQQWQKAHNIFPSIMQGDELGIYLDYVRENLPESSLKSSRVIDEIDFINHSMIYDEQAYMNASRAGRGFGLREEQRAEMWIIYAKFKAFLNQVNKQLWSSLAPALCANSTALAKLEQHDHVIVDEAQFFEASWFELVKLTLKPSGQLFLCADPNQGFLRARLSWRSVGLNVVGRTKWLRKSYRTTRAILETAHSLLPEVSNTDKEDFLQPDFEGMQAGTRPLLIYADSPNDAVTRVINEIKAQRTGDNALPLTAMLLIYGENTKDKSGVWRAACAAFGEKRVWWFNKSEQKRKPPDGYDKDYLRMAYLNTATGLEGAMVFLIGMESILLGHRPLDLTDTEWSVESDEARRKLYMAMTRAGQRLVLISAEKLPDEMAQLFELVQ